MRVAHRTHRLVVALVTLTATAAVPTAAAAPEQPSSSAPRTVPIKVEPLTHCPGDSRARCGSIFVPLDPAAPDDGMVEIAFEVYRATRRPTRPAGTIVAVEGGPGYSTRDSRDYYLELFRPLLDTHQLLLVDNRGTGGSDAINCRRLQSYQGSYIAAVGECGRQLGASSDLWGTSLATDDLVAVLDRLGVGRIHLYGDSYGTFFAQSFAIRHPERVRTVVLDAAYPVTDQNPWYPDLNRALVRAFTLVCDRDPGCSALGGDPVDRMRELADALAEEPLAGSARNADGVRLDVTVDVGMLAYVAASATYGSSVYRELDAAGRAYLDDGDPLPLLRIAAEQTLVGDAGPVREFSEGLYIAVICNDYPQHWDIDAPLRARRAQYRDATAELRRTEPDAFAPFTIAEWTGSPWTEYRSCIRWPAPSSWIPPAAEPTDYPDVPVLVLVGDLDTITSAEGSRIVADNFPGSTFVEVANVAHVTALSDHRRCASQIVVRFVWRGGHANDLECASEYNEIRTVDEFPRRLADVQAAPGLGQGPRARVVTAAGETVGDMIARWWSMYGSAGVGLRGGRFTTTGLDDVGFRLHGLRWVRDLEVSGRVAWDRWTGGASARLRLSGAATGRLTMTWNDWDQHAEAHVRGRVNGGDIDWMIPAP